ncbi:class I SAM-dependent methyltransferase [Saccharococcus sp. Marseille-Q5394]|uniref:class I SAM-dependent methyltransferase n=1 Tax=Saccharococcus sp. Marseille-Q5394 TaxID=2972778 RepID=UPI0021C86A5F|nr:class I SAM-dependent methyltransferase [Saccharococcus sp. Marseille-Q5394]
MKLNKIEFMLMNNPARRLMQKSLEFKKFKYFLNRNDINLKGKSILDAGCGSGYSTYLLEKEYSPSKLYAFDLMESQIDLAKKRKLNANFFVGDITKIGVHEEEFDAVFVFGVLHHVPAWKEAIKEFSRVLKPGGVLLLEDMNGDASKFFKKYFGLDHPNEAFFEWSEFTSHIEDNGLQILYQEKVVFEGLRTFLCIKPTNLNNI